MNRQTGREGGAVPREGMLLALLAAVQFTHVMDFMVMMPLGPQLMRVLAITPPQFGFLVSAYTFAASIAGLVAAFHLDRFDRRHTLLAVYACFTAATLACGLASDYWSLLAARAAAGTFGGVLGAAIFAIVGDAIPEGRRGAATGTVGMAFSLAAVAGVPTGLALANAFNWRAPFLFLAMAGTLVLAVTWRVVPSLRGHVAASRETGALARLRAVAAEPNQRRALALIGMLMLGGFSVIPYLSPYLVANVGFAESDLPYVYLAGGLATLFTSRLIGRLADRHGKARVFGWVAAASVVPILLVTHLPRVSVPVALVATTLFMVLVSGRFVPAMALVTGSAEPASRGTFLGVNASVQQLFASIAASASGLVIGRTADGTLTGYGWVGIGAVCATLLCIALSRRVRAIG